MYAIFSESDTQDTSINTCSCRRYVIHRAGAPNDNLVLNPPRCAHGELDKIYETLVHIKETKNVSVDLLVCCGDFQAVRNPNDLACMACPVKYRKMNTFYKYFKGKKGKEGEYWG
eukprot:1354907-Amorphochlora_amoeboformis.AAC.1